MHGYSIGRSRATAPPFSTDLDHKPKIRAAPVNSNHIKSDAALSESDLANNSIEPTIELESSDLNFLTNMKTLFLASYNAIKTSFPHT